MSTHNWVRLPNHRQDRADHASNQEAESKHHTREVTVKPQFGRKMEKIERFSYYSDGKEIAS